MALSPTITALRDRIGQHEKTGPNWPTISLGSTELDLLLPPGGLATGSLYEVVSAGYADFPAVIGFSFGILARILQKRDGYILWAQPTYQAFAETALYPIGLDSFGIDPNRVIKVNVEKAQNTLWALDEALASDAVTAVVGLMGEDELAYDFTAARRLSMRASSHGATALILLRDPGFAMATAAELRWSIASKPSFPKHCTGQIMAYPGAPRWDVRIAKSRRGNTGHRHIEWNNETLSFRLAAPLADRAPVRVSSVQTGQSAAA